MTTRRAALPWLALLVLFGLSGTGALIVETTWMRWFRQLFGATAPATSATLVAFFSGHAIGAALAARRAMGWREPLRIYAGLELGATLAAALVPVLLAAGGWAMTLGYDGLRTQPIALATARFGLALVASLPAACCFGATLPAISAAAVGDGALSGRTSALLYGTNTVGAAAGAALAAFWLPAAVGVAGTYATGLGALATAGLGAWVLAARRVDRAAPASAPRRSGRPSGHASTSDRRGSSAPLTHESPMQAATAIAALSGFGSFAAQVLLVQAYAQVLNQSVFAFGAVLVGVLVTLALGAFAVTAWMGRTRAASGPALVVVLVAAGCSLGFFPRLLWWATDGLQYVGAGDAGYLVRCLGLVAVTAAPALFAGALLFPLCLEHAATRDGRATGARLGRLVAANTLGAIAGALAAPFVLLPALGVWQGLAAVGAAYALAAILLPTTWAEIRLPLRLVGVGAVALAVAALAAPQRLPSVRLAPGETLVHAATTPAGAVAVVRRDGDLLLRTDNHYVLGGTAETRHQERQGHLPLLLKPDARTVAYLGSATGSSAGAMLAHPIERLFLVELVPAVSRAAAHFFAAHNRGVHADPRTRVVEDDARNFVRATAERFDLVVADLFVPWRAGTGSLYTREHFGAVRRHLTPDGVFCQWLPLYQFGPDELRILIATFGDVFPRAVVLRGDFYGRFSTAALCGFRGVAAEPEAIESATRRLAARGEADRWVTTPAGFWSLYVGSLAPIAAGLADVPRQTDGRPRIEYAAARSHVGGSGGKRDAFVGPAWLRLAERITTGDARDPVHRDLARDARRAVRGGLALQRAGALFVVGENEASLRAFEEAERLLPDELVRDAPADPTAAEVWRDPPPDV